MKKLLPILALVALLAGCNSPSSESSSSDSSGFDGSRPIQVVATIGMVADIVREVGGEHVEVSQICGPGVDPHLYKATRDDVAMLSSTDMVFYSGLMLEGKMSDTLIKMAQSRPVVPVTSAIDDSKLLEPPEFEGHFDPHVWNDVSAWSAGVQAVETALAEFDPTHASEFAENAKAYVAKLDELHKYGVEALATIPESSRVLVTSHDAFNYMGKAYGLEVEGVQGISTESEAGLKRIAELVDMLVEKDVKAVFIESSVPRKSIDSLIEGAKAKGHDVIVGGELFSDAMGAEGTYEGTYLGMLDHNITIVTRALGGEAPEKGLSGKLSESASE
ncbi:MAG: zinc ABC transporter substrate-binding protein [Planctomycetota bacterium]